MNDPNGDQRHLKRLYEKFRSRVVSGKVPSDYIDEDDLIDIYDYAGDNGDEYVQLMSVICAMNQCPDNEDMAQRRAYFFTQNLGLTDTAKHLMAGHQHESALWDILSLLVSRPEQSEAISLLDGIVGRFKDFDDETIIQLVGACNELGLLNWLKEKKNLVQKRCLYPDTFLYEFARISADNSDHEHAIALLDELTGIEPFNVLYWQLMADEYIQIEDFVNALNAIDYALAIDGSNVELQLMRAQILYDHNTDKAQAIGLVQDMLKADASNVNAATTLCVMLSFEGRNDEAVEVIKPYIEKFPGDRSVVANALVAGNRELNERALSVYMRADATLTEEDITAWACEQEQLGRYSTVADILLAWLDRNGSITSGPLLLSSLYLAGRYDDVCRLHDQYLINPENKSKISCSISMLLLVAFSHARIGAIKVGKDICSFIESVNFRDFSVDNQRIEAIGARLIASHLKNVLNNGASKPDIDRIDPFLGTQPGAAPLA